MAERLLAVSRVTFGMLAVPWAMRRTLFAVLSLPAALLLAVIMAGYVVRPTGIDAWLLYGIYLLAGAWFAVRCHRVVLLGPAHAGEGEHRWWTWRETRFVGAALAIYLCCFLAMTLVLTPMSIVLGLVLPQEIYHENAHWVAYAAWLPWTWVLARLSLALPAIALDRPLSLRAAWALSRGNGWRLMIVVGLVPFALKYLPYLLRREEASALEQTALALLLIPLLIIQVAALSLSYRELQSAQGNIEA